MAEHPDVFLCRLHRENPDGLVMIVREQAAGLRKPPLTVDDVLNTLARHVPNFVSLVRPALVDTT